MFLSPRYVLTFFFFFLVAPLDSNGDPVASTHANYHKQHLDAGKDLILGDNWSPFDLQVYGSYYESISACELQPQQSKRLYINGGLLDITHDDTVVESSVIPVPDAAKVVLAPSRTQTTTLYASDGTHPTGSVSENTGGIIYNGAVKRDASAAGLSNDLRTEV
jgi:hypothetical protein